MELQSVDSMMRMMCSTWIIIFLISEDQVLLHRKAYLLKNMQIKNLLQLPDDDLRIGVTLIFIFRMLPNICSGNMKAVCFPTASL